VKALRWVGVKLREHKRGEEEAAFVVDVAWIGWRIAAALGLGASVASAAILATSSTAPRVYHPSFSVSTKGAALIERNEGVRYHPYNDATSPPVCTVGVGHAFRPFHPCSAAEFRETFTPAQVTTLLLHDVSWAENGVNSRITHPITQYQFDALVDLAFNAGPGSLDYSGIANEINRGDLAAVPGTLAHTAVTAGHVYLEGLHRRRLAEGALFAHGFYGQGIGYYLPPKPPTPAQRKAAAKAAAEAKLRARTGYFAWLGWYLHEGAWKRYTLHAPAVRPHVPAAVPAVWWRRERAFVAAR